MFAPLTAKPPATAAASPALKTAQPSSLPPARRSDSAYERAPSLQWSIGNQAKPASSPPRAREPAAEPSRDRPAREAEPALAPDRPLAWDFGKLPLFPAEPAGSPEASAPLPGAIQRKLAIGAVDDPLEHEADRVADMVMRMPDPDIAVTSAPQQVSRKCAACEEEDKQKLQMKPASASGLQTVEAPGIIHEVLHSPGQPLDPAARAYFEPRFGYDFGSVRIHVGDAARASAAVVGARAYTVGAHIAFADGAYAPHSDAGRRLLAHELAHTIQQGGAAAPAGRVRRQPDDPVAPGSASPDSGQGPAPLDVPPPAQPPKPAPPAKPACLPVIVNPAWTVAATPVLDPKNQCTLATTMTFKGTVSMPVNCPGKVYFVQYVKPNRSLVSCLDSKELGFCVNPALGLDGSWPYSFGDQVNTDQDPGSSVPINDIDTPGQKGLSRADLAWVRFCQNDAFTTYIVFEDRAGTVTSLGWMSWTVTAHAERDGGTCPIKTVTPDCAGWTVTGKGSIVQQSAVVGSMGPQQALDRTIKPANVAAVDCDPAACPKAAAPAPAPSNPAPAPSNPAPAPSR